MKLITWERILLIIIGTETCIIARGIVLTFCSVEASEKVSIMFKYANCRMHANYSSGQMNKKGKVFKIFSPRNGSMAPYRYDQGKNFSETLSHYQAINDICYVCGEYKSFIISEMGPILEFDRLWANSTVSKFTFRQRSRCKLKSFSPKISQK